MRWSIFKNRPNIDIFKFTMLFSAAAIFKKNNIFQKATIKYTIK